MVVDPVISIGVGFFIILCILAKYTGVTEVSNIVDDNKSDSNKEIKSLDDIDKYDIVQTYYDLDAPISGVTAFADGSLKTDNIPVVDDILLENNKIYLIYKKENNENNDQLSQLIEPIEDNIDIETKNLQQEIHHILDFSSKKEETVDLTGTTLISLKSIKQ